MCQREGVKDKGEGEAHALGKVFCTKYTFLWKIMCRMHQTWMRALLEQLSVEGAVSCCRMCACTHRKSHERAGARSWTGAWPRLPRSALCWSSPSSRTPPSPWPSTSRPPWPPSARTSRCGAEDGHVGSMQSASCLRQAPVALYLRIGAGRYQLCLIRCPPRRPWLIFYSHCKILSMPCRSVCGVAAQVRRFSRYVLGEGMEKRSTDFAAEVAAQTGQA